MPNATFETFVPKVSFEKNSDSDRVLTDQDIEDKLAQGALISNTALSIFQAKTGGKYGQRDLRDFRAQSDFRRE